MLTYVESGTEFTRAYGDIDENFYNSLLSVLWQFHKLIKQEYIEHFKERLIKLNNDASPIAWGYGDEVDDIVSDFGII